MAKRKAAPVTQPESVEPSRVVDVAAAAPVEEPDISSELLRLRDMSEAGATLQVFRWAGQGANAGKWSYLERLSAPDFDIEDIRARYGGGRFRLRLVTNAGQYVPGGTIEVVIEGVAKVPQPAPVAGVAAAVPDQLVSLLARMDRRLEALEQQRSRSGADGPGDVLKGVASALAAVVPLFQGNRDGGGAKEMIEMFLMGRDEGAKMQRPEGPDWSPLLNVASSILQRAKSDVEVVPSQPPTQQVMGGGVIPPKAPELPRMPIQRPAWYGPLAPYLGLVVNAAKHDFDPVAAATAVADYLEQFPDGHPLWALLTRPSVEIDGELAAAIPEWLSLPLESRRSWLDRFVLAVGAMFRDDEAATSSSL